ncbi:hypothetical protein VN97_g2606 [Penicillium thymicola]|uniref:Uncharacterized protein n=1 Tax=Penicillium thymicola TaxID=293382 RepID=A0AAI9TNZ7_PENTH|nr:hypothetical protein VN97_g2606 [Penicillium thymicola]
MLRIPELRDENGRDLLNDNTSSDKSSRNVKTEWMSDTIGAFDRVWHDPARRAQSGHFQTGSRESSRTAVSQSRQTLAPDTYPTPYGKVILEQSHPYWHTTEQPYQLPHDTISRFYSLDCLKEKLLGPENYKDWADRMKNNLERCGGLWTTDADPEVSTHGSLNLHLSMMVFSNAMYHSPYNGNRVLWGNWMHGRRGNVWRERMREETFP